MKCYDCGKEMVPAVFPMSKAGPDLQDIPAGVLTSLGEIWYSCPDWHRGQWVKEGSNHESIGSSA